ncbi:type I iodothyronine deiodinase-like [Glandiceps talaboti]
MDALAIVQSVFSSWVETFAKYNLTAEDFPKKTKVYREILRRYAGDEELLDIIGLSGWKYYRKTPLSVGDDAPDIELISVDDGKKHLISELHQDKNKPLTVVVNGRLGDLYNKFKGEIELLVVYIQEAHPSNGFKVDRHSNIEQHINLKEKMEAAEELIMLCPQKDIISTNVQDADKVRFVVDDMNNTFAGHYDSFPDNNFIVKNGKLLLIGNDYTDSTVTSVSWIVDTADEWLTKYFTGIEADIGRSGA